MATIGFSTGAVAYGDFKQALRLLEPTRVNAVELSALRAAELPMLLSALPKILVELRRRYRYISFHAPTDFHDEEALVSDLVSVANAGINVVVHPDTISEVSAWRRLGRRLCLENMDSRKTAGRTAKELGRFYEQLPEAMLCFDVAHARQFDATMTEGLQIIEQFRSRLAQVHLSEVNSKGRHFAMSFAAKLAYEPFVEILSSVPVILEAVVNNEEIVREIAEAEKLLTLKQHTFSHRVHHIHAGPPIGAAE